MVSETALALSRPDLEDSIAALCAIASIAHVLRDHAGCDAVVDLAAEMAKALARPDPEWNPEPSV